MFFSPFPFALRKASPNDLYTFFTLGKFGILWQAHWLSCQLWNCLYLLSTDGFRSPCLFIQQLNLPFKNDNEFKKPKTLDFSISYLFYTSVLFHLKHVSKAFKRNFNFFLITYHDHSQRSRFNNPPIYTDILNHIVDSLFSFPFPNLSLSPSCTIIRKIQKKNAYSWNNLPYLSIRKLAFTILILLSYLAFIFFIFYLS